MSKEMLNALDTLEAEKGISKEIVIDAIGSVIERCDGNQSSV